MSAVYSVLSPPAFLLFDHSFVPDNKNSNFTDIMSRLSNFIDFCLCLCCP